MVNTTSIEDALRELFADHNLTLEETTWKRNFNKGSLQLGIKIRGELAVQQKLFDGDGQE
ncbi:MAG TPA: hypothetical protein VF821_01630 [Lentzea sp.]